MCKGSDKGNNDCATKRDKKNSVNDRADQVVDKTQQNHVPDMASSDTFAVYHRFFVRLAGDNYQTICPYLGKDNFESHNDGENHIRKSDKRH